ncbi:MAG: thermonuclease family protein [Thermodesulfovibrionales bacterium]
MSLEHGRKRRDYFFRPKSVVILIFLIIAFITILQDKLPKKESLKNQGFSGFERDGIVSVITVHDGDTVSIKIGGREEKIRLIGIDAPELGQEPWGKKAKRKLQDIIRRTDKSVRIELDVEERDKYGRLLAYLWTKDGRLINEEMVRSGYALLYTIPPNVRYVERLRKAQEMAYKNKVGIWSERGLEERPSDYRETHPRR